MNIVLGLKGRDIVTKFTGVVVGKVEYMTGCSQYLLVPEVDKDGKIHDGCWFDVQRVERVKSDKVEIDNGETPGCDISPSQSY